MLCLALFLRVWRPANPMTAMPDGAWPPRPTSAVPPRAGRAPTRSRRSAGPGRRGSSSASFVFVWGTPQVRAALDGLWVAKIPVAGLHELVQKVPPGGRAAVDRGGDLQFQHPLGDRHRHPAGRASSPGCCSATARAASCGCTGARSTSSAISLLTIACMLAIGFVTRYSGTDATLGLALANTGWLYPFFGTLHRLARRGAHRLGHVVERALRRPAEGHGRAARAQSGADGGRQQLRRRHGQDDRRAIDRRRLDGDRWYGHEGSILRFVFFHSGRARRRSSACW